jgi:chaperonin GroES
MSGSIVSIVLEDPRPTSVSLEPLDDYLVIEALDEETETRAGLILPASAEAHCRTGIVTAVGSDAGEIVPGDKVLFPKDKGYDVRLSGTGAKVIRRGELIARIHD